MAFRVEPYPGFSWSITRQRMLDTCPRQYYLRYYLSHNGWLDDSPERSRLAYRLSKLTTLDAVLGAEMDERAREIERAVRAGKPPPSAVELEERTRLALRAAWRSSRDERAAFERSPKRTVMLRSFYLEGAPPDKSDTDRVNEKLTACTENLLAVSDWERIAACAQEGCVLIPDFAGFFLDSVKVFAAPDLAYVAEGVLHVIDWKSGKRGDSDPTQVLLSAYCTGLGNSGPAGDDGAEGGVRFGDRGTGDREDPRQVVLRPVLRPVLHYLLDGTSLEPDVPHDLEQFVRDVVEPGIAAMRNLLLDPWENAPLPEDDFERRESGLCRRHCDFSPLCGRD
jgi:hypothetical protein